MLLIALAEEGYKEKKSNAYLDDKTKNAGDKNYTKYARDMDKIGFYNGKKQGAAWCDVFVDWCMVQAFGMETALKITHQPKDAKKNLGAGCKYSRKYYDEAGRLYDYPEAGDQIFFYNSSKAVSHTGLVVDVDETYVYTIEGNAGGKVCRKKYKLGDSKIAGYGRPEWDVTPPSPVKPEEPKTEMLVRIVDGKCFIRETPDKNGHDVGTAHEGDVYPYGGMSVDGWESIVVNNRVLWVSAKYARREAHE